MKEERFLKWDFQSIILILSLLISGISIALYFKQGGSSFLLTFIGVTMVAYALAYDLYRKRKKSQ